MSYYVHMTVPITGDEQLNSTIYEGVIDVNSTVTIPGEINIPYVVIETIVAILAVIGNLFVIVVFVKYPCIRTTTNYYVMSLATADLLVGSMGIPFAIATSLGMPKNFHACIFMNSLLLLLCTGSIFSLVAVTIDRFWAIKWPLLYPLHMTANISRTVIAVSWVLAAGVGLLPSMGWNAGPPPLARCFFMEVMDMRYLATLYFCTILLPMAFMAVVYGFIYKIVRKQVRRMSIDLVSQKSINSSNTKAQSMKSHTKAAKILAVIVTLFGISWIPLYTFNTIVCFCPECTVNIPKGVVESLIVLSHFNSAWNPALYAWGMKDFRGALWKLCSRQRENRFLIVFETQLCKGKVKSKTRGFIRRDDNML